MSYTDTLAAIREPGIMATIERAYPGENFKAFVQSAETYLKKDEQDKGIKAIVNLCTPISIAYAIRQCAVTSLTLDPIYQHACLIAYGKECKFQPMYRGLIHLCTKSGSILKVEAALVFDGDKFDHQRGDNPTLLHIPKYQSSKILHAYCIVWLTNGAIQRDSMTKEQLDHIRKRSKAGDKGPWGTDPEEMYKKTVVKRTLKMIDVGPEMAHAVEQDNEAERVLDIPVVVKPAGETKADRVMDEIAPEPEPVAEDGLTESEKDAIIESENREAQETKS